MFCNSTSKTKLTLTLKILCIKNNNNQVIINKVPEPKHISERPVYNLTEILKLQDKCIRVSKGFCFCSNAIIEPFLEPFY